MKTCTCGHSKFYHASSLKGVLGACQKEIVKDWQWCECEKFEPAQQMGEVDVAYWSCKSCVSNNSVEFNWCYACGAQRH